MNHDKSRHHLQAESTEPDSLKPELKGAGLKIDQYKRLLKWWIVNGTQPHDSYALISWRKDFKNALSVDSYRWRELIQRDQRRQDERSKSKMLDWLVDAKGDPLMFLNLANISPYQVLLALDEWKATNHTLKVLRAKVRSKVVLDDELATLKKAIRVIEGYESLLTCQQDWVDYWKTLQADGKHINFEVVDIQGTVANSHSLRKAISMIEAAKKNGC